MKNVIKSFRLNRSEHTSSNILKVFIYYCIIVTPYFWLSHKLFFVSDDLALIRLALKNPFPVFTNWGIPHFYLYRPLVTLSFFINYCISKLNPASYYLFNLFIHVLSSTFIFLIIFEITSIKRNDKSILISFVSGIVFLIIPQNITNFYWISGRTDLLCGLFIFSSLYFMLRYLKYNKLSTLIISLMLCILGFMCKETAIIVPLYSVLFWIIFKVSNFKTGYKKILFPYLSVSIIYIIFRFIIFGSNSFVSTSPTQQINDSVLKYLAYGISSLFSPIGTLDIFYFWKYEPGILLIILLMMLILSMILIYKILGNKDVKKIIVLTASFFLMVSSLLIYIKSYPHMRLMYMHYPLLLIGVAFIISQTKNYFRYKLIGSVILAGMLIFGNILISIRYQKINDYCKELKNVLPAYKEYKTIKACYVLTPLGRVGESYGNQFIQLMASEKYSDDLNYNFKKFQTIVYYEGYSLSNIGSYIKYKTDSCDINITLKNSDGLVPLPTKKFSTNSIIKRDFLIKALNFKSNRTGIASKVLVHFRNSESTSNSDIIFFENGKLKRMKLSNFLLQYD